MALLASSLAYQRHHYLKIPVKDVKAETAGVKSEIKQEIKPEMRTKVPDSIKPEPGTDPSAAPAPTKPPTVYYCTRTHSQLAQVAEELKNCSKIYQEHLKMCVLGSRQHLCINRRAKAEAERKKLSLDEVCKEFLDVKDLQDENTGCGFGLNKKRITKTVESLKNMKIWDIEDAYKAGEAHKGCPYYSTREIFENANYVLSPYNYIIDPDIRRIMNIDLQDSIVIFDEAHNIEDITREAASFEINRSQLVIIENEILNVYEFTKYLMLRDLGQLVHSLIQWIDDMSENLTTDHSHKPYNNRNTSSNAFTPKKTPSKYYNGKKTEESYFGQSENLWDGEEFVEIFEQKYYLNLQTIEMYLQCLEEITKQNEENDGIENRFQAMNANPSIPLQYEVEGEKDDTSENPGKKMKLKISTFALSTIRRYLRVFSYMLVKNKANAMDYRICLQKKEDDSGPNKKRKSVNAAPTSEVTFNIWCLSGAVVFQEIAGACHSVLLSSGTLSPLDSFAGELKTSFPIRVEASHVINLSKQLKVALVSSFNDYSLNSTYDARQSDAYLDTIGAALLLITKQTPGGVLMFLPSYSLLYRCQTRWNQTKLLRKIEIDTGANMYFEPKDTKEMKKMLIQYYEDLNSINSKAIMIGVCRGKVSEGINFSDHYARAVIVVGIPYPSLVDLKIHLKREYQDTLCAKDVEKNLQSGYMPPSSSSSTSTPYAAKGPFTSSAPSSNYKFGNSTGVTSTIHCNGSLWYKQQAFRAINQAVGRCIRHKDDFGAIILLDPRFHQEEVKNSLSRWMRDEAVEYERLEDFALHLKHFFQPFNSYERLTGVQSNQEKIVQNEAKIDLDIEENILNQDDGNSMTEVEDDRIGKNSFFDNQEKETTKKFESVTRNNRNEDHIDSEDENPTKQFKEISISQTFQDIMDKKRQSTDREEVMKKYSPIIEESNERVDSPFIDTNQDDGDRMVVEENQDRSSPFTIKSKVSSFDMPDVFSSQQFPSESYKEAQTPYASKNSKTTGEMNDAETDKEKRTKSSSKRKKKRKNNEEVDIQRVVDFKLSLPFIREINRSFLFFQNQSNVPTYLNTNDIINVLTLNSISSARVSSSSLSSLFKYLFPLPSHLHFLKLAFEHGLFIRQVYLGDKFETIVFPVVVESVKNGINRHSSIPFAALSLNDVLFGEEPSRLPLAQNEEVRCVDYWCREDEVVYRFICYSNIKDPENNNDSVKEERDITSHYQVLFAKIIATTTSSILRQSESYGNPRLLYLLQKDQEREKENKDAERVDEDVLSDLSDSVATNRIKTGNSRPLPSKTTESFNYSIINNQSKVNRKIPIIIDLEENM